MATATEIHAKAANETKDLVVDCAGALATGETITAITNTQHSPAGLTITGVARNAAILTEPGRRPIQVYEGIQAFVGGGAAATTYTITFTFTTSGGQTLEAIIRLRVT
jgi:hypothetical protein